MFKHILYIFFVLIFLSCTSEKPYLGKIKVSGQIIEEFSGNPIEGIEFAIIKPSFTKAYKIIADGKSDNTGMFYLESSSIVGFLEQKSLLFKKTNWDNENGAYYYTDYLINYCDYEDYDFEMKLYNRKTEDLIIYLKQYSVVNLNIKNESNIYSTFNIEAYINDNLTFKYNKHEIATTGNLKTFAKGENEYNYKIFGVDSTNTLLIDTTIFVSSLDTINLNIHL